MKSRIEHITRQRKISNIPIFSEGVSKDKMIIVGALTLDIVIEEFVEHISNSNLHSNLHKYANILLLLNHPILSHCRDKIVSRWNIFNCNLVQMRNKQRGNNIILQRISCHT